MGDHQRGPLHLFDDRGHGKRFSGPRYAQQHLVGQAFLNAFSAHAKDPLTLRNRCILETMYACGLRVSETASLKISSLNFDENIIRAFGKGSKERIVPMGRTAVSLLKRYWKPCGRFF
ncbi:Tyrosine recombinase XerD [bioreactor metagenome]|uniref:Tyrosine recombinase XerD n=1 Tax=bioreactor metagenome TaxID=1076179 RepID=A0A645I9B5_9ZZZZ